MRIIVSIISFCCIGMFLSCQRELHFPEVPVVTVFDDFPNEVGNHWRYTINTQPGYSEFIDVDIIGTKVLPGGQSSNVWIYKFSAATDTNYVVEDSPFVKIYEYRLPVYYEKMRYKLPLQVGDNWIIPQNYQDSTKVLASRSVTVPAGTFDGSFEILKTRVPVVNSWVHDSIWFKPKVGVVKLNQFEFSLGPVIGNGIWQLMEYTLK